MSCTIEVGKRNREIMAKAIEANEHRVSAVEGFVMMPKALTAENGAKGLMTGKFKEPIIDMCFSYGDICHDTDCEDCHGTGQYITEVPVSWSTIKEIYAMAVKHYAT